MENHDNNPNKLQKQDKELISQSTDNQVEKYSENGLLTSANQKICLDDLSRAIDSEMQTEGSEFPLEVFPEVIQ